MKRSEEHHLIIVWEKARHKEEEIIADIKQNFELISEVEVTWSQKRFSENLSRFYGANLPPGSGKEEHCGTGPFLLLVFKDKAPAYGIHDTSRGREHVNSNVFLSKTRYREWTDGGHKVHATNSEKEFKHDITLLFGEGAQRFVREGVKGRQKYKGDLVGSGGWRDLAQFFSVLNETTSYAVLRNFEQLPDKYYADSHGDIDLITDDYSGLCYASNSSAVFDEPHRVHRRVRIKGEDVYFDFRFIGDGYYDTSWQKRLLDSREKRGLIYVIGHEDYFYSLLYHALVHKRIIAEDYISRIVELGAGLGISLPKSTKWFVRRGIVVLGEYLARHNYGISVPEPSVLFNIKHAKHIRYAMWFARPLHYIRKRLTRTVF